MFTNIISHIIGNGDNSASRKPTKPTGRSLQFEYLEVRELLSVSPLQLPQIEQELYAITSCPAYDESDTNIDADLVLPASEASHDLDKTFTLHSSPSSRFTIYLDFNGHVTTGTPWNTSYTNDAPIVTPAFSLDNDSAFSDAELERIQYIWQRVAEDFAPFDVDVTTEEPSSDRLFKSGSSDTDWGIRVVVGGSCSDWYGSGAGGVAYINSFEYGTDTPAFVFPINLNGGNEKSVAEAISHEVGHTLGLSHDGTSTQGSNSYYNGANGWAPIMGVSYYQDVTQWSKGEYPDANQQQDDLAIITAFIPYKADDHASDVSSISNSDKLVLDTDGITFVDMAGIIEQNTDIDVFQFTVDTNSIVNFNIISGTRDANLDILAKLWKANDSTFTTLIQDDTSTLNAYFTNVALTAGTYYLSIEGTGKPGVYSDYASIGTYVISGTLAGLSAPTNVKAVPTGKSSIQVSWNTVAGANSYNVEYKTANGTWKSVTTSNSDVSYSIDDNDLPPSTLVSIRIQAIGSTNSAYSSEINVKTDDKFESNNTWQTAFDLGTIYGTATIDNLVFGGGTNLDYYKITLPSVLSDSTIQLKFATNPESERLQLRIYDATNGSSLGYNLGMSWDNSEYTYSLNIGAMNWLTAGTYIIEVSTFGSTDNPPPPSVYNPNYSLIFNVPSTALPAPSFTTTTQTDNSVTLNWNVIYGVNTYVLEYKKSSDGTWSTWTAPATTATNATVTGLTENTEYNFRLTVTNGSGSAVSTIDAATSLIVPITPVDFKNVDNTKTSATFSWTPSIGAAEYILQFKKSSEGSWTSLTTSDTQTTVTNLDEDTLYDFRVQAKNVAGVSGLTSIIQVNTSNVNTLPTPANLRAIQSAKTTLALDWNDVEGATGYILQRKSVTGSDFAAADTATESQYAGSSDFVTVDTVTESQYVDTNLTAGTTYLYRIQAIGSAFSDEITATTLPASTATDTPIITSAVRSGNVATIEWSDLGTNYKYYVFKGNVLLTPDGLTDKTSFTDTNATAVTVQYTVYANNKGRIWTRSLPVILTDANVKPEIIAHEVTQTGGIKLSWNVPQGLQFYVFRNGSLISGKVTSDSWTDESPLAKNEYVLYVNYIENGSIWAYSPTYVVQPTTSHAAPAASPLDAFWAEYDYDGLSIDDEMLSAIV